MGIGNSMFFVALGWKICCFCYAKKDILQKLEAFCGKICCKMYRFCNNFFSTQILNILLKFYMVKFQPALIPHYLSRNHAFMVSKTFTRSASQIM